MYSPETTARLDYFRQKSQTPGHSFTTEEQKEIISLIREDRVSAGYASTAAKAAKPKTAADGQALLGKLAQMLSSPIEDQK